MQWFTSILRKAKWISCCAVLQVLMISYLQSSKNYENQRDNRWATILMERIHFTSQDTPQLADCLQISGMLNRNSVRLTFQLNSLEKVEREQHALIEKLSISELIYMGKMKESRTCDLFFRCSLGQLQVHCMSSRRTFVDLFRWTQWITWESVLTTCLKQRK